MAKHENIAVISTGGKQYRVQAGDKISAELLEAKEGSEVTFTEVLLLQDGDKIQVGTPTVSGVSVTGRVLGIAREDKIRVFRKKRRKGYKKTTGHRQTKMLIEIESVGGKKAPAKARKAEKVEKAKEAAGEAAVTKQEAEKPATKKPAAKKATAKSKPAKKPVAKAAATKKKTSPGKKA
jgi:large subunit ribosomal protein L21